MITVTPIQAAELEGYLQTLHPSGSMPDSHWRSSMAEHFRMTGEVQTKALVSLFKGMTPDGKIALFPESLQKAGIDGWQIQITAPPSVRDLWVIAPARDRKEIADIHMGSVATALYELEQTLRAPHAAKVETQIPCILTAVSQSDIKQQSIPLLQTEAFVPNMAIPFNGPAQRVSIAPPEVSQKKRDDLNEFYQTTLADRLHSQLGLEFHREPDKEMSIVGGPTSLDFSKTLAAAKHRSMAHMLYSSKELKFQEWQAKAEQQGWGKTQAAELLDLSRGKLSVWSPFEKSTLEKLEKSRQQEEEKPKVTKTLFKTTTHYISH